MDLLIVGSGLFGLTIAERAAHSRPQGHGHRPPRAHRRQRLQRDRPRDGHRGAPLRRAPVPHLQPAVWEYVNRFTTFTDYLHRVYTTHRGDGLPAADQPRHDQPVLPVRPTRPSEARALIQRAGGRVRAATSAANLEEKAIALIGRPLYEAFIRDYTAKQWQTDPRELPAEIISRLPVRYTYDNRYFNDTWEGLPDRRLHGVARAHGRPPEHRREARTPTSSTRPQPFNKAATVGQLPIVYTGPVDRYFDYAEGALSWRTLDFEREVVPIGDFQGTSVMNYADARRPLHADPRVPALPPRARRSLPDRPHGHHARVLAVRDAARTSRTTR